MILSKGLRGAPSCWPQRALNTGMLPTIKGSSGLGRLNSKRTVRVSKTLTPATSAYSVRNWGAASLLTKVSNECLTSWAVTGSLLLNRALGRILKTTDRLSVATLTSSASKPYEVVGSSIVPTSNDSNTSCPNPGADVPLRVKGLNLSKLVTRDGGTSTNSPPRGACGLT